MHITGGFFPTAWTQAMVKKWHEDCKQGQKRPLFYKLSGSEYLLGTMIHVPLRPHGPKARNHSDHLDTTGVASKEPNSSYHIGGTLFFTVYTHYGNLI